MTPLIIICVYLTLLLCLGFFASRLFLGTDLGVLASTDGGASWAVENTGFATAVTEWMAIDKSGSKRYLFAFTHGRGAWRVALEG